MCFTNNRLTGLRADKTWLGSTRLSGVQLKKQSKTTFMKVWSGQSGHQPYQKIAVRNDRTSICTIRTLIKTTKPTSVPVQRPNSDLLLMPCYELSTLITAPTIKFPLIWSVVGPCSRNIKSFAGVPYSGNPTALLKRCCSAHFSQLNNTRIQIACHET